MSLRQQALSAGTRPVTDLEVRVHLQHEVASLQRALDAALSPREVPIAVSQAMRAPDTGTQEIQTISLDIDGTPARIALHPLGHADAERELAARAVICAAADRITGRQLRPMDPAIGAIDLGSDSGETHILILNDAVIPNFNVREPT
ncbi:hypothetical protein ACTMTF_24295 [Nonomuraea sp. ZG12]|uniref:hypothetical protein n=1 Tax=Nonomuraea sp. ZG12 TaxID=3452207 RepID=UPI003F898FC8